MREDLLGRGKEENTPLVAGGARGGLPTSALSPGCEGREGQRAQALRTEVVAREGRGVSSPLESCSAAAHRLSFWRTRQLSEKRGKGRSRPLLSSASSVDVIGCDAVSPYPHRFLSPPAPGHHRHHLKSPGDACSCSMSSLASLAPAGRPPSPATCPPPLPVATSPKGEGNRVIIRGEQCLLLSGRG